MTDHGRRRPGTATRRRRSSEVPDSGDQEGDLPTLIPLYLTSHMRYIERHLWKYNDVTP